ncbi:MAG: lytic transglycosylase domain-containing protein [Myxococcota bacterium]
MKMPILFASLFLAPLTAVAAEPDDAFPVSEALEGRVWFWEQIFGRYDSDHVVFHDRESPDVVWSVVELPDHPNEKKEAKLRREALTKSLGELRTRLGRLERNQTARDEDDKRLLEVAAGDRTRLKGAVARLRYQHGVADRFRAGIKRSRPHMKTIHAALDKAGVPRKLAALPFIESMFKPSVHSHAGAAGLWQLMPATARGLGLSVTKNRDDRLNVTKATHAAARMLRDNYRMLQSWPLAITGYNHGPYGVKRATQALGTRDLGELIKRYKKSTWGFASKNFYAEFIAASRVYERATARDADEIARGEP